MGTVRVPGRANLLAFEECASWKPDIGVQPLTLFIDGGRFLDLAKHLSISDGKALSSSDGLHD